MQAQSSFNAAVNQILASQTFTGRNGGIYDPLSDDWRQPGSGINIHWGPLRAYTTDDLVDLLKRVMADGFKGGQRAEATINGWFNGLRACLEAQFARTSQKADDITDDMIAYWVNVETRKGYRHNFKGFMVFAQGKTCSIANLFPNVSSESLDMIKVTSNAYEDIMTLHPTNGPFLPSEVAAQDRAVEAAYGRGDFTPERYCFIELFRTFGMRPESLARMKIRRLTLPHLNKHGHALQFRPTHISIPFLKNDLPDEQAVDWPLGENSPLADALSRYLADYLPRLDEAGWLNAPLFTVEGLDGMWGQGRKATLTNKEPGYEGHPTMPLVQSRFTRSMERLGVTTRRTGEEVPMHYTPRRMRHTVGTRLAREGFDAMHIGMFLGHANERSSQAYIDVTMLMNLTDDPKFNQFGEEAFTPFEIATQKMLEDESLRGILHINDVQIGDVFTPPEVIGVAHCAGCPRDVGGPEFSQNAYPCLGCPRFKLRPDANLAPMAEMIRHKMLQMMNEDWQPTAKFDPRHYGDMHRAWCLVVSAEVARRKYNGEFEEAA